MKTIIFKATDICNSNCIYCHAVRKEHQPIKTMPFDILERFFERANTFLTEWPEETLKIIWHGGEPLTLGPQYFYKALELKQTICNETGCRISFDMQSNLTLFSKEYIDVLKKMEINNFGTSFELFPGIRGNGGEIGSDIYNQQFIEAISLLEDEGFSWGIIYVVTKLALKNPIELFRTLTNFVPSASVMFNPVIFNNDKSNRIAITPEEFVDFLGEIFSEWWSKRERYPSVDPFKSLTENLVEGSESLLCVDSGACADTHLSVSPDGMVWQCGRSSDCGLMSYGSIVDFSLSDIMNHPDKALLRKRLSVLKDGECKECRFWSICHGGCPLDALAEKGSVMHRSPWCWTKKGFIEKYFEPITGFTYQLPISQPPKLDEAPAALMTVPDLYPSPNIFSSKICGKEELPWIGPINCLDNVLMISGILQQIIEENPSRKINLVNKASYREIFQGHPAIAEIGLPPKAIDPIRLDYSDDVVRASSHKRVYQMLAEQLGLKTPAKETLFVPWKFEDDKFLMEFFSWKERNILICPYSELPRKQMNIIKWGILAHRLIEDGFGVMQIADMKNSHVRGIYSIQGLIHLKQVISFIRHFDLIITSHNFFMQVAQLHKIPAVVLWGPSDYKFFGYQDHCHLQSVRACGKDEGCVGFGSMNQIITPCPMTGNHCMNSFETDTIYKAAREII
jgi:uncharacterized protein